MGSPEVHETPLSLSQTAWGQIRFFVAALLLFAAAVKVVSTPQILAGGGLLGTAPRLTCVVAFEASMATYLIIGNLFLSWILTLVVFVVFVVSAGYALATGQACNCFGDQVDPQVMLIIDMVVLAATGWCRPVPEPGTQKQLIKHLIIAAIVGTAFAGLSVWRNQVVDRTQPLEFLLADMLNGKPWPLDESLHPDLQELGSGKWMVVVVRRDCDHCRELIEKYFRDPQRHRPDERTAVFVAGNDQWPFQLDHVSFDVIGGTFLAWSSAEPFVASPAIFLIDDGTVVEAADGNDSDQFIETLLGNSSVSQ